MLDRVKRAVGAVVGTAKDLGTGVLEILRRLRCQSRHGNLLSADRSFQLPEDDLGSMTIGMTCQDFVAASLSQPLQFRVMSQVIAGFLEEFVG